MSAVHSCSEISGHAISLFPSVYGRCHLFLSCLVVIICFRNYYFCFLYLAVFLAPLLHVARTDFGFAKRSFNPLLWCTCEAGLCWIRPFAHLLSAALQGGKLQSFTAPSKWEPFNWKYHELNLQLSACPMCCSTNELQPLPPCSNPPNQVARKYFF